MLSEGFVTELGERLYDGLPLQGGRLVVSGAAGSGKTASMLLLLLHVLGRRKETPQPIPVWLTLGSWNPRVPIGDWVVRQVVRDYPGIELADWPAKVVVREMYERGALALFMDGLDEMPAAHRPRALSQLNQVDHLRMVLTSRPTELKAAISESRLFGASIIETLPLAASDAEDFLLREQLSSRRAMWRGVVAHVVDQPEGPLATAFQTPLALSLAREIYMSVEDPRELLDVEKLPDADAVVDFLLGRFLHVAYPAEDERERAIKILRWVASRISPTRDLAWWKLPAVPGMTGLPRRFAYSRAAMRRNRERVELNVDAEAQTRAKLRPTLMRVQENRLSVALILILTLFAVYAVRMVHIYLNRDDVIARLGDPSAVSGFDDSLPYFVAAAVVGVVSGRGASYALDSPSDIEEHLAATTPAESHASERWFAFCGSGLILLAGIPLGVLVGPAVAVTGCVAAALSFLAGPAVALLALQISMPLRGIGPVRLMSFFDEAHRRQVLRQVGPIYQFRHAAIQDYLVRSGSTSETRAKDGAHPRG